MSGKFSTWEQLEASLPEKYAKEISEACRYLHAIYEPRMVDWFANLYDPATGGFYYSNSARDTEGYGADAESVIEMFYFLECTGMTDGVPYEQVLPEWMKKKVGEFIVRLQKPDGYFYHPQHNGKITDLRRARDLGTCKTLIRKMGAEAKYPYPGEVQKDGKAYDVSLAPEQYRSFENFKQYLKNQDIPHRSYNAGSILSSSWGQVKTYGDLAGADFCGYAMDLLDSLQRPENGLWHETVDYYGANGVHKITNMYIWENRKIPYIDKTLESIREVMLSDTPAEASVNVYNPWHVLAVLIKNKKDAYGASEEELQAFKDRIYEFVPAAIRKSADKLRGFKTPDGGMSYSLSHCCPGAYGLPSAVPGSDEGDINGACCASVDVVDNIYRTLGVTPVPMFTPADFERFMAIVEAKEAAYKA